MPNGYDTGLQMVRAHLSLKACSLAPLYLRIFAWRSLIVSPSPYFPDYINGSIKSDLCFLFPDSPRLYTSTNPWKITATFHTISSTREEYIATIDSLKASAPSEPKKGQKRTKLEQSHLALIVSLEKRIDIIDAELNVSNSLTFPFVEDLLVLHLRNAFLIFYPPHVCTELFLILKCQFYLS